MIHQGKDRPIDSTEDRPQTGIGGPPPIVPRRPREEYPERFRGTNFYRHAPRPTPHASPSRPGSGGLHPFDRLDPQQPQADPDDAPGQVGQPEPARPEPFVRLLRHVAVLVK